MATAGLAPSDIAWPIRNVLSRQKNATILLGEVTAIDTQERCVHTASRMLDYDYLVLATGATHAYFGNESWADHAPGLKSIDDATDIRRRILMAFERAEMMPAGPEREAMMTFVIVGAGPTGVEPGRDNCRAGPPTHWPLISGASIRAVHASCWLKPVIACCLRWTSPVRAMPPVRLKN